MIGASLFGVGIAPYASLPERWIDWDIRRKTVAKLRVCLQTQASSVHYVTAY